MTGCSVGAHQVCFKQTANASPEHGIRQYAVCRFAIATISKQNSQAGSHAKVALHAVPCCATCTCSAVPHVSPITFEGEILPATLLVHAATITCHCLSLIAQVLGSLMAMGCAVIALAREDEHLSLDLVWVQNMGFQRMTPSTGMQHENALTGTLEQIEDSYVPSPLAASVTKTWYRLGVAGVQSCWGEGIFTMIPPLTVPWVVATVAPLNVILSIAIMPIAAVEVSTVTLTVWVSMFGLETTRVM